MTYNFDANQAIQLWLALNKRDADVSAMIANSEAIIEDLQQNADPETGEMSDEDQSLISILRRQNDGYKDTRKEYGFILNTLRTGIDEDNRRIGYRPGTGIGDHVDDKQYICDRTINVSGDSGSALIRDVTQALR